jgi:hypothetical protein
MPPLLDIVYQIIALFSLCVTMASTLLMRQIAQIPRNTEFDKNIVCCDSDHDSLSEIIFSTGAYYPFTDPVRVEVWEHEGWNCFGLAYADTGDNCAGHQQYPWPYRIKLGNASPMAAGDIDGDGLTDIVCITCHYDTLSDTLFNDVITVESPDRFSYPCSLTWHYPYESDQAPEATPTYYPPDLDGDGHREILVAGTWIWENRGNDSNELVWCNHECGFEAFGDFGGNGRMELAGAGPQREVWENTEDNRFEKVYEDTSALPGIDEIFMTNDIDRDGRPEFYVTCFSYPQSRIWLYMYQDESDGGHQFTRTPVDSLTFRGAEVHVHSAGGDIDGDGIDECIWVTPESVRVYKASGDNDLREVWTWVKDQGMYAFTSTVSDVNNDGYNELLLGVGNEGGEILIFEVDAVDLVSPNHGSYNIGDTVPIRWVTHSPPRCDSLSLFLRRDSLWNLQTIVTGLPGTDTLYRWVVPNTVPDTGRIVVMAYGPGHQYDMSDSAVTFIGGGVAEGTHNVPLQWSLSVCPNPARGAFSVRYDVPRQSRVSVGVYDADGRLVRSLSEGEVSPGRYEVKLPSGTLPAGIYFLRLDTPGFRDVKKAVAPR